MKKLWILALGGTALIMTACGDDATGPVQRPDVMVRSIGFPAVSCPGGQGTCVVTVDVTIANVGAGSASAFNFEVTMDGQATPIGVAVPGGLLAGTSETFTVSSPAGNNCYDPDCTISVLADDLNDLVESDETNNTAQSTIPG